MLRVALLFAMLIGLVWPAMSLAQPAPLIIDQGRADRAPAVTPAPPPETLARGQIAAPAAAIFTPFVMTSLEVKGTSLPQAALDAAAASYLGRELTVTDLAALADEVGRAYAASDVALYTVFVPRQSGEGGVARLVALEGRLADVQVAARDGDPEPNLTRAYAAALLDQPHLSRSQLERQLGLMRDVAGAKLDVQLLQGSQPGEVRMAVKTPKDRFQASLSVNNRGSAFLGRTQLELSLTGASLLREGDQTRLTLAAPTDWERFQYAAVSHAEPLGATGATLNLSAGHLRTKPKIAGFELTGTATTASAQVIYPLVRSNTRSVYLSGGLDGVDSDNALFGRRISREQSRVARVAASFVQSSAKQAVSLSGAASHGLDALGARAPGNGAPADFTKLSLQASYSRATGPLVMRLASGGQYAATRLPASEQYAIGGPQFGRAFPAAVASGDSGYGVSGELAWRPRATPKRLAGSELYGFVDRGEVWSRAPVSRTMSASSAGGGLRLAWASKGMVEFELAKPIDAPRGASRAPQLMINFRSLL